MWNDNESLSDYIDYSHLLKAVTTIIDTDNLLPCSIGIYGDWGSGKSSLMRMVEQKYEEDSDILVIKFNGWLFEGYEDAKSVLMGRIVDEIISKRKFSEKAIKYAARLLKRVDWIKVAGSSVKYGMSFLTLGPVGLAGVSLADTMSKMKDVDYEKYIKEKQEETIWLKSHQVQRMLAISPGTLQNLRINGTLPYSKVGGVIFYDRREILTVMEANKRNSL